jgi:hypothetical protein
LPDDDNNRWVVQHAHVLPDGSRIVFFGGQQIKDGVSQFGPHGEGQGWWWIPTAGGEPQAWVEAGGNAGLDYTAASSGRVAYTETSWAGALCGSQQKVSVVSVNDPALPVIQSPVTGLNAEGDKTTLVRGISWSPPGDSLAFAAQPNDCTPEGPTPTGPMTIYVWTIGSTTAGDAQAQKLIEGSHPQWVGGVFR